MVNGGDAASFSKGLPDKLAPELARSLLSPAVMVRRFRIFRPLLAGATLKDRLVACLGALIGVGLTGLVARTVLGHEPLLTLMLAAPMGASAVLLFAVPASPLAQPWPIVGGNTLSALVGVAVFHLVREPMLAAGLAVALAIAAMSLARCLHPPGGAVALTAVIGGPMVAAHGYMFALAPIALDCVVLLAVGWLFHRVSGHSYPHRAVVAPAHPPAPLALTPDDVDAALDDLGEPLDISREDLDALIEIATAKALERVARAA